MKRIHLSVGALIWLGAWLVATSVRDRLATGPDGAPPLMPTRGETVAATCAACHDLVRAEHGVGPHLVGIVDRRAGSAAGYEYSPAMRTSRLRWTRERLRDFLVHPEAVVPGTRMALSGWPVDDALAVIDHLETLAPAGVVQAESPQAQGRSAAP